MTNLSSDDYDTIAARLISGRFSHVTGVHQNLADILKEYDEYKKAKIRDEHREWQRLQFIRERARRCEEPF